MEIFSEALDPFARVKDEYPRERLEELGIPGYALPKMHSTWSKKGRFQDERALLRQWVYSAFLERHEGRIPCGRVVLFTWVMAGGLGDWSTQIAAADVLKEAYPHLDLHLVTIVADDEVAHFSHPLCPTHLFRYSEKVPKELLDGALVVQIPTYYPEWEAIKPLRSITVGEYGFIDSEWFHPESGTFCMGLNSLEKGLLFGRTPREAPTIPDQYFAYLYSERGYAVYLHALLGSLKHNPSNITLYACNPLPLLKALQGEDFRGYGLQEILFSDGSHVAKRSIETGKTLKVIAKKALPHDEVERLMLTSQPFVGCRGDRSFTEAVGADKLYFYDPPTHMRPFLHDLLDIVRHYFFAYPALCDYIKSFLNTTTPARILGKEIAELLQNPTTAIGMQKLNALLKDEFTFNPTLIKLVTLQDESRLDQFLERKISLEDLLGRPN